MSLSNPLLSSHVFLQQLEAEPASKELLLEGRGILTALCHQVEGSPGLDIEEFYELTQAAASELNALEDQEIGIDSEASEALVEEFELIAHAYGFAAVDIDEALSPREW